MAERSLMIRCAVEGRYFAAGMDFPSARVFDVANGTLAGVVEVPPQNRSSLAVVSLTALALGTVNKCQEEEENEEVVVGVPSACYAAVGLSNGTVLLHNVERNELVQHLAVSDTQQSITAMAFCGRYLFCLSVNRLLHVVDCVRGERVVGNLRVQHEAGAIAVVQDTLENSTKNQNNNYNHHNNTFKVPPHTTAVSNMGNCVESHFRVFVAGPTNAIYALRLSKNINNSSSGGGAHTTVPFERLVSFASQASRADFAWMGRTSQHPVVVTANAQEGLIRVWDATPSLDSRTATSRCRRSLLCGQRIVNVSVQEGISTQNDITTVDNNKRDKKTRAEACVVATTFTGSVLVFELGTALLTAVAEPIPTPPSLRLVSAVNSGRLLFAALLQQHVQYQYNRSGEEVLERRLLLLRGRFAVPRFELLDMRDAAAKATRKTTARGEGRVISDDDVAVFTVPFGAHDDRASAGHATHDDMEVLDHAWATHSEQVQQQQQRQEVLAARAIHTSSEAFVVPVPFHAKSVKELPLKVLTLEQRLKQLSLSTASESQGQNLRQRSRATSHQHALGLATVPLYQALHANDASAVMELLTVASRSTSDIRATVMALQLPYCLQLLELLAKRVRGAKSRSPLFAWIDAIIHYRGVEMFKAQAAYKVQKEKTETAPKTTGETPVDSKAGETTPSPPKDFVAPLLHQYRNMTALYDPLATMYGRLSIFKSVRPSERSVFVNSDTGVIFPAMFTEIRCAGGEFRTVRVRSKRDPRLQKNKKKNALELLRKARRLAAAASSEHKATDSDDVAGSEDELDMDALDEMRLSDDSDGDAGDYEEEGEDEEEDMDERGAKRVRAEEVEMLAEPDRGSSYGVDSSTRSSDAEFDSSSDDDVNSEAEASEEEDEEDDDDEEEEGNSVDDGEEDDNNNDDDEDDDDDGMGEDMSALLAAQGGEEQQQQQVERRRYKRVKTDH